MKLGIMHFLMLIFQNHFNYSIFLITLENSWKFSQKNVYREFWGDCIESIDQFSQFIYLLIYF